MRLSRIALLVAVAILGFLPACSPADAQATISLTASRPSVLSDGKDMTELIAEVRDSAGHLAPDGTAVNFLTSMGQFDNASAQTTRAGSARIHLRSPQKGTATVTATSGLGGLAKIEIVFTDDPSETFLGNAFATVFSNNSTIYSAVDK